MGGGKYSTVNSTARSNAMSYSTKRTEEVFTQRSINNDMSPYGVKIRESRDSDEHPNSLAVVLGLDVTGSMGSIPHSLIAEGLNKIMSNIMEEGIKDPQVLFLAIGDHQCDEAPLQVGQFESSDELMDRWLKDVYLEGRGGGNGGESYHLAWYFASQHTSIDCFEKRKQKGFLFTIGDEPVHNNISIHDIKEIMGPGEYKDYTSSELLEKATEKYHVFHLHLEYTYNGRDSKIAEGWEELMRENVIFISDEQEIPSKIAKKIIEIVSNQEINSTSPLPTNQPQEKESDNEEVIL
jgi:hypothetical protein